MDATEQIDATSSFVRIVASRAAGSTSRLAVSPPGETTAVSLSGAIFSVGGVEIGVGDSRV